MEYNISPSSSAAASILSIVILFATLFAIAFMLKWLGLNKAFDRKQLYWISEKISILDRAFIKKASYLTGTRYQNKKYRILILLGYFSIFICLSIILPWPTNLLVISLGILGIFAVFRHYSIHEDEVLEEVPKHERFSKIQGDLQLEVCIAASNLFVFAPIAFSILQENGHGFVIRNDAGAFTFILLTIVETLKSISLVDYYDLFAEDVGFTNIAGVDEPSDYAKWSVLVYRISLNLLLLAALKRIIDISQRRSKGLDLRHLEDLFASNDNSKHRIAVEKLGDYLKEGSRISQLNAVDLLEQIVFSKQVGNWFIDPDIRSLGADYLQHYGQRHAKVSVLLSAIDGYRTLLRLEYSREQTPECWSKTNRKLGQALFKLGRISSDLDCLHESVAAYEHALETVNSENHPAEWAEIQHNMGLVHSTLADRADDRNDWMYFQNATDFFKKASNIFESSGDVSRYADLQYSIGVLNAEFGEKRQDLQSLESALVALNNSLDHRSSDRKKYSDTCQAMGNVLSVLGELKEDNSYFFEAVKKFEVSLENIQFKGDPHSWAMAHNNLGLAHLELGERNKDSQHLYKALGHYRNALRVWTFDNAPHVWAVTQNNIGVVYKAIAATSGETSDSDIGIEAFHNALRVHTLESSPSNYADTSFNLGNLLAKIATLTKDGDKFDRAIVAYNASFSVYSLDQSQAFWMQTRKAIIETILNSYEMTPDKEKLSMAIEMIAETLKVEPYDVVLNDWRTKCQEIMDGLT